MASDRTLKRNLISKVKKGKIKEDDFIGKIKYHYNQIEREYILSKLPSKYKNLAYNNPLPKDEKLLCSAVGVWSSKSSLFFELQWYFEVLFQFTNQINLYLHIKDKIEVSILENNIDVCYKLLEELDEKVCCSLFSLQTELFINELNEKSLENKELIKEFPIDNTAVKLLVLLDFARLRIDNKMSYWQYDSAVEQHKKQYQAEDENLLSYIEYKINPARYDEKLGDIEFLTYFDSDFSIIDRYNSLKNLVQIALFEGHLTDSEKKDLIKLIRQADFDFEDTFWNKLLLLIDTNCTEIKVDENTGNYFEIQDEYLNCNYKNVIKRCNEIFARRPNFTELYIFYVKALIFTSKRVEDFVAPEKEIFSVLKLIYEILLKDESYFNSREDLLNKYYKFCHFDFSVPILEFLFNEFRLEIPEEIKYMAYLKSRAFRYNSYALFVDEADFMKLKSESEVVNLIKNILKNQDSTSESPKQDFFVLKLKVGCLIKLKNFDGAIGLIQEYYKSFNNVIVKTRFLETWLDKTLLKCYLTIKDLPEVSNLIVNAYFKNERAYDHFYDQKIIQEFNMIYEPKVFKHISIPILFELYNQPQSSIYDRIADFLIANDLRIPSDLIESQKKYPENFLIYFLDKVCTKENIQDSPFLNSIESLESERIKILNFLKEINPAKTKDYNFEILEITKEGSLRKGLLQIHESRIYVDVSNIKKYLAKELPEVFDRYLGFSDLTYSAISSLKLNEKIDKESVLITFYFLKPIKEEFIPLYISTVDPRTDPNAVAVPIIRFTYFENLFNKIKEEFIYNEDYGFRSFLSMRIRHGTFSNVLRSVFDKHDIISSKDSDTNQYLEVDFWNGKISGDSNFIESFQKELKEFSGKIDSIIDDALDWINVQDSHALNSKFVFNFYYNSDQMYALYHNFFGKIEKYEVFIEEVFSVLYLRLEQCLEKLREKISNDLKSSFLKEIDLLESRIERLDDSRNELNPLKQKIVSCKTDLQVIVNQMTKWFNVSKNQYIEEFPIEMIIQNSLDYINSIHTNSIDNSEVNINNRCSSKFKGKYFEHFGDMLINIFDNIVSKNRELGNRLKIEIKVEEKNNELLFLIRNNLSSDKNKKDLKERVNSIVKKVAEYKEKGMASSFEIGSGFLKICKCISVDLEQEEYVVEPKIVKNQFEVNIKFKTEKLKV